MFSACAGAALYRRAAVLGAGGFDERFGTYLEDVDLGLRLRMGGWRCRWEPRAVARHAGGGSSGALRHGPGAWVERNTLLLVARAFPARWLHLVAYRQLAWAWHAARAGELRAHLAGVRMALPLLPAFLRERRALRRGAAVPVEEAVPPRPIRGPRAGGHPSRHAPHRRRSRGGTAVPQPPLAAPHAAGPLAMVRRHAAPPPRRDRRRDPARAPASALAQSAGDEQYEDPFAGENQSQATPTPTPAPAEPGEPAQAPAPSAPEAAPPAPTPPSPTSAQAPSSRAPASTRPRS